MVMLLCNWIFCSCIVHFVYDKTIPNLVDWWTRYSDAYYDVMVGCSVYTDTQYANIPAVRVHLPVMISERSRISIIIGNVPAAPGHGQVCRYKRIRLAGALHIIVVYNNIKYISPVNIYTYVRTHTDVREWKRFICRSELRDSIPAQTAYQ